MLFTSVGSLHRHFYIIIRHILKFLRNTIIMMRISIIHIHVHTHQQSQLHAENIHVIHCDRHHADNTCKGSKLLA